MLVIMIVGHQNNGQDQPKLISKEIAICKNSIADFSILYVALTHYDSKTEYIKLYLFRQTAKIC
jgi:hypothetical protein